MNEPAIRTVATTERAVARYDLLAGIYAINAAFGSGTSRTVIGLAAPRTGESALEIGVGTGRDLVRLAQLVGPTGRAIGLDLSRGMIAQARRQARPAASAPERLVRADARRLPLPDAAFDVVLVSRVLDVLDTPDIAVTLAECRRVLKPGGRLALTHMSKPDERPALFELLYRRVPGFAGLLFVGRPVVAGPFLTSGGFEVLHRAYSRTFPVGSETVLARRD